MIQVDFNDKTHCRFDAYFVSAVVSATIKKAVPDILRRKKISVSVAAVPEDEIAGLNRKYRKKNKVTDVLSFSNYKNEAEIERLREKEIFLGELIICCEYIRKSGIMNGVTPEREAAYVISHGTLHLLGWRHGKPMFALQDEVATQYERSEK